MQFEVHQYGTTLNELSKFQFVMVVVMILLLILPTSIVYAGNSFAPAVFRIDSSSLYNARDYITYIHTNSQPPSGTASQGYLSAWLGIDLAQFNGQTNSALFSQVGILMDSLGARWFVYSEAGVSNCRAGSTSAFGGKGCIGQYSDLVGIGGWFQVELVTYNQGFWVARVYNYNGASDVARITSGNLRVYDVNNTVEEVYAGSNDPMIPGGFLFYRPRYMQWGTGFQLWPASSNGNNNYIYMSPPQICPPYFKALTNLANDPRYWYAGTGSKPGLCTANPLF
jgi:hypothetical protein